MTKEKWLFIGDDARLSVCKDFMCEEGRDCKIVRTDRWTEKLQQIILEFQPHHIVLPIRQLAGEIPLHLFKSKPTFYVGNGSKEWLRVLHDAHLTLHTYVQEELFVWENAHLTAEAFLKEFYKETARVVKNTSFHVAGFGRVGKMVARLLQEMGGDVKILARSPEQLAEAEMMGYKNASIDLPAAYKGSYLVNTIPARWLTIQRNRPLFIFDLASAPGCLVEPENIEYYTLLPGLPGKHFPIDAAIVLKDALNRMNSM